MSKSNIKNINTIFTKREPYINFNQSTRKSLLFKLKKSTIWLSSNRGAVSLIFLVNKNDHYFKYFNSFNITIKPQRKRKVLTYNPRTINHFNSNEEILFIKKVKVYI